MGGTRRWAPLSPAIDAGVRFVEYNNARWALATGTVAGIATLFQPIFALPYFCWTLIVAARDGLKRNVLILCIAPVLIFAPWCLRNYLRLGIPGVRGSLGLAFYTSFSDCAHYGFEENLSSLCQGTLHPNSSVREAEAVRLLGEAQYDRDRFHAAIDWISKHPALAGRLVLQRFWFFWFPSNDSIAGYRSQRARQLALHALTLASFLGIYLAWKQRLRCVEPVLIWLLLFTVVYYVIEFDPRYRYPVLWITWLFASHALVALISVR